MMTGLAARITLLEERALSATSGPIPAGSPMVIAIRGFIYAGEFFNFNKLEFIFEKSALSATSGLIQAGSPIVIAIIGFIT